MDTKTKNSLNSVSTCLRLVDTRRTVNGSGQFYDTLSSNAAVLTVTGSGTSTSPMKFTYSAPSGASPFYEVNYANYTVATNFGVSQIGEYKSSSAVPLVSSVVLPDGSQ